MKEIPSVLVQWFRAEFGMDVHLLADEGAH